MLPIMNVTTPVGVFPFGGVMATRATKDTFWETVDGFGEAVIVVAVDALETVCEMLGDVLPANWLSPLYAATIKRFPAVRLAVVRLACPKLSGAVPIMLCPCTNVIVPVAEGGVTVAVKVTGCPT